MLIQLKLRKIIINNLQLDDFSVQSISINVYSRITVIWTFPSNVQDNENRYPPKFNMEPEDKSMGKGICFENPPFPTSHVR